MNPNTATLADMVRDMDRDNCQVRMARIVDANTGERFTVYICRGVAGDAMHVAYEDVCRQAGLVRTVRVTGENN